MIYCGLDMSSKSSAFSIFDNNKLMDYGLWKIPDDIIDWRDRILWMGNQLDEFIKNHKIDKLYCEDVPLIMNNPQTLKILSALQGMIIGVCSSNNIKPIFINVSQWRSDLGLFTGKQKDTKREEMKKSSIEYANKTFGLELIWKSPSSKFNEDDIADAINVVYSQIIDKKAFGRK